MDIRVSYDANTESGIRCIAEEMSRVTREHFAARKYGDGLEAIFVVLMCRNPDLKFKRRIRFSKRDKILYLDVMLGLSQMVQASHLERKRTVISRLTDEIPATLHKYSLPNFDEARFVQDLTNWLTGLEG